MSEWQAIETAPKDGRTINVRRIYKGHIVYDGPAAWRTIHLEALWHPIDGNKFADEEERTGWCYPDIDKFVPGPTHWRYPREVAD